MVTRRVLLVADLTPGWADTVRALQARCPGEEFDLVAPHAPASEIAERLSRHESDATVVVVDLGMDPYRGMGTVAACRQTLFPVPVIVVAANPTPELVRRIRLSGIFYLALDPVDAEELGNALESAFSCVARRQSRTSACRDRPRILLIDDDPDFLISTAALLDSQGYSVSAARSGKEGVARLAEETPDLVVLDVMMEDDCAGYGVNQQIKYASGLECARHVPVLMVSSIPVDPATRFSRAAEVDLITPDAYMTKPLAIPEFLRAVRKLLGEREVEPVG